MTKPTLHIIDPVRDLAVYQIPETRQNNLEVRLAQNADDVIAAQSLRYRVFYQEMNARPSPEMAASKRDFDMFDDVCDHLLVIDNDQPAGAQRVVGTYRLIRRSAAARAGRFYSADEYDLSPILAQSGEVLELGRACVDAPYRNRPTMQLLWQGIAHYISQNKIELMFGCANFPGTDASELAVPLSYLYHYHLAPPQLRARALPHRFVDMNQMPQDEVDTKAVLASLPPLIKGYLRLGCFLGDGAVIDEQFNSTDVFIVLKTELITDKYLRHFDKSGEMREQIEQRELDLGSRP